MSTSFYSYFKKLTTQWLSSMFGVIVDYLVRVNTYFKFSLPVRNEWTTMVHRRG